MCSGRCAARSTGLCSPRTPADSSMLLRETVSLLTSLIFKSTYSKITATRIKPYLCNGCHPIAFNVRHALRIFQSARPMGVFPRETLTAGAEVRSRAYADLGAGIRAFRSANAPAPYVGVADNSPERSRSSGGMSPQAQDNKTYARMPYTNPYIPISNAIIFYTDGTDRD